MLSVYVSGEHNTTISARDKRLHLYRHPCPIPSVMRARSVSFVAVLFTVFLLNANGFRTRITTRTRSYLPDIDLSISRHQLSPLRSSTDSSAKDAKVSLDALLNDAAGYRKEALDLLASSSDSKEVESFRVLFLGKNGKITGLMKMMRGLSNEDKPKLGEVVNDAKSAVEGAIESAKLRLEDREINDMIAAEDIGNLYQIPAVPTFFPRAGRRHPLSLTMDLAVSIFEEIGYEAVDGAESSPHIENDFFNFEALGMPPNHPARDMQDTFYLNTTGIGEWFIQSSTSF